MKLNLGSGGKRLEGYINVDIQAAAKPDVVLDIGCDVFPWPDSSVDGVQAWHILEHLSTKAFFHCVKEVWRVLKPGALFGIIVPHPRHDVFINDPTHIHPITPDGMLLFSTKHRDRVAATGAKVTSYADYLGVDFDLGKVTKILDPHVDPQDPNLDEKERTMNNIIVEYRFTMAAVK